MKIGSYDVCTNIEISFALFLKSEIGFMIGIVLLTIIISSRC